MIYRIFVLLGANLLNGVCKLTGKYEGMVSWCAIFVLSCKDFIKNGYLCTQIIHIKKRMRKSIVLLGGALVALLLTSCQGGRMSGDADQGDTLPMKYAHLLTIVKHGGDAVSGSLPKDGYAEVMVKNPWKKGTMLHRYILVPKGEEGDSTVAMLAKQRGSGMGCVTDTVRTPVVNSVVFTSPHCQLLYELGAKNAIRGVCDLNYINIPDVKKRAASSKTASLTAATSASAAIVDCGSSMAPDIECIIALKPQALLISPFENSGGYGKLDKMHIPIIEAADYMENSPLGRAEWIKFYGMLFGSEEEIGKNEESNGLVSCEARADSLFSAIEKEYLSLKAQAAKLPKGRSVLTERKTGGVWYVPGGQSTMGILLKDANAQYIFANDTHSGSLAMSPEQILAKGKEVEVWAFKYFEPKPLDRPQLLQEYDGYKALRAFQSKNIYECNTITQPYFELTSFHPEILLREFIVLSHVEYWKQFGGLRFYRKMNESDDLPLSDQTVECRK